jgi:hypothetical protein
LHPLSQGYCWFCATRLRWCANNACAHSRLRLARYLVTSACNGRKARIYRKSERKIDRCEAQFSAFTQATAAAARAVGVDPYVSLLQDIVLRRIALQWPCNTQVGANMVSGVERLCAKMSADLCQLVW